jgi:hypothetical protein
MDVQISLDYVVAAVYGRNGVDLACDLETGLGLRAVEVAPLKHYKTYAVGAVALCSGGDREVTVQWNAKGEPIVIAPGFVAGRVAQLLQRDYHHQCSRKDAAVDFTGDGRFEEIARIAVEMANTRVIRTSCMGDWTVPGSPSGRTLYVYSMGNWVMLRIYEHSKLHEGDVTCRVEVQIRPEKKDGKRQLADLDPHHVFGLSHFAVELLGRLNIPFTAVPRAKYVRQLTDLEQRLVRLWMQYGRTLDELVETTGGDLQAFVEELFRARDRLADRRAKIAAAAARPKAVPLICL